MSMDTLQNSTQNVSSSVEEAKHAADYAEALFESIKIINESMMQDLHYDETIECTITDDSNAAAGEYRVTNGSAEFFAYSFEKYRVGENVYVTIPQGDYSKDKIIAGKVLKADNAKPFKYVSPLENFLDITGNLDLNASAEKTFSLLANDVANTDDGTEEGYLYEPVFARYGLSYGGFTRFAISADFCSLLSEYQCERGDYGLRCEVTIRDTEALISATKGAPTKYVKNFYLNTEDMIGNPYGFDGYFRQEKLFDISELGAIESVVVYFEQASDSFYDIDGRRVPCYRTFKEWDGESFVDEYILDKLPDNLFVKNVNVALGFDMRDQEGEYVQLYSFDPMTYSTKVSDDDNEKTVHLRWLHEDETGQKLQMKSDYEEEPFEIRWYRFTQGAAPADKYCGVNWERITVNSTQANVGPKDFTIAFKPNKAAVTEQIKAIVLYGQAPGYYEYKMCPFQDLDNFKSTYYKDYFLLDANSDRRYVAITSEMAVAMEADGTWATATYYYLSQDQDIYRAAPLVFSNEEDIPDNATIVSLSALTLECYDLKDPDNITLDIPTFGNYLLYNEQSDLIDRAQQNVARLIKWTLNIDNFIPSGVSKVEWHYPTQNTMLNHISEIEIEQDKGYNQGLMYYIGNHYSSSKDDNTIVCTVTYDGVTYTATKELTFGQAGTMGSSATFLLDFIDSQAVFTTALKTGETQDPLTVQAILYDENNRLVKLDNKYTISWSWFTSPKTRGSATSDHIHLSSSNGNQITLTRDNSLSVSDCYILQATLTGWNNTTSNTSYPLTTYLPIPIRRTSDYKYITGADRIVYLTDGSTSYYEGHYIMHKQQGSQLIETTTNWAIQPYYSYTDGVKQTEEGGHTPTLAARQNKDAQGNTITTYKLAPAPFYFEGSTAAYAVTYSENGQVQWTQPIVILESRYFSSMVNSWDGKELQLDTDEGSILASMIGAGKKTGDNQFSGVLLGDWSKNSTDGVVETGLYGFHNGKMSFGFKDNGTAFIGENNRGQLIFDGNESTITSSSYRNNQSNGMLLDFDNPMIKMRQSSADTIRVGKKIGTDYIPYAVFSSKVDWTDAHRTDLYIKTGDNAYSKVTAWSDNYKNQQMYEQITTTVSVMPFSGITNSQEFNAKKTEFNVQYFETLNAAGTALVRVYTWNAQSYNKDTVFYYPGAELENRMIALDATATTYPLAIGNKFKVGWDGTLVATDGEFSGVINATGGTINGFLEVNGTLYGARIRGATISGSSVSTTYLYADSGSIGGWAISDDAITGAYTTTGRLTLDSSKNLISGGTIEGSALVAKNGVMSLDGYIKMRVEGATAADAGKWAEGKFGYNASGIPMGADATSVNVFGIGMECTGSELNMTSEIKTTVKNTGLKFGANYISTEASNIVINANNSNSILHLKANNKVTIESGALVVTNSSVNATQPVTFDKTLGVTGAVTLSSTLGVAGAVTLSSTLGVTGKSTLGELEAGATTASSLTVNGNLEVTGTTTGVYATLA